jgi:hypothetical protein
LMWEREADWRMRMPAMFVDMGDRCTEGLGPWEFPKLR